LLAVQEAEAEEKARREGAAQKSKAALVLAQAVTTKRKKGAK
jgi:hypothetical protein